MKFLTSRVVVSAIASFIAFAIVPAIATTPEADFKTVTSKAYVDSLISNNDISGHKVNGAPLSNAASYFYGEGTGAANTATKTVSIPSITGTPAVGQVIVVKPATTNTSSTRKINLNNTTAYSVLYRGSANDIPKDVWTAYVPSIFVLDVSSGTKYWRYVGTSPAAMTWSATETSATNAYSTTFDGTANNWLAADENKYVKGDSLAGALALKQNKIPVQTVTIGTGDTAFTAPLSLVAYPTTTDGVIGQLAVIDESAVVNYIEANNIDTEAMSNEDLIEVFEDLMLGVMPDSVPTSKTTGVLLDLLVRELGLKQNKIAESGYYYPNTTSANPVAYGQTANGWLDPQVKGTGLVTKTLTDGVVGERKIFEAIDVANYHATGSTQIEKDIQDISIPTVGAMMTAIANGANAALPTGTAGTVVTYNGTNPQTGVQQFTETAIVDAPDYTGNGGTLVNGDSITSVEYVENALGAKQPIIQPSTVSGKTQIVVKPAYGGNAGDIGYLTLDTASLTVSNNSYVPSSKLVWDMLALKLDRANAWEGSRVTEVLTHDSNGALRSVSDLYRVPIIADSGVLWAGDSMTFWAKSKIVPTMDTLALSLTGVFDAVDRRIQNYQEASDNIRGASVPSPSQIEYTGVPTLTDGAQLFWLPSLAMAGDENASSLLKKYQEERIVPAMDELAFALDGVLRTHETTEELNNVLHSYDVPPVPLFEVSRFITQRVPYAIKLFESGYLQTFAPSLELLMNESRELYRLIEAKQNKLSGTNGNLVTYGATAGTTGSKAIATTITNNADTVPNTAAVYNAVNARQNKIPVAGKYRSSNTATTDTDISDWTDANVKGTALPTKTGTDGVIGERKIFEAIDVANYHATGLTQIEKDIQDISIPTVDAMMTAIENGVNAAVPTGTAGTVVTYNGTNPQTGAQQFTETAIVDAPDYTGNGGTLVNGDSITSVEYVENALGAKQPIIQPSTIIGKTQIVVKPAYGENAGNIGYLTFDATSLTNNNSYVPSSKLVADMLALKLDWANAWDGQMVTEMLSGDSNGLLTSVTDLYQVLGMSESGMHWAGEDMEVWANNKIVPTMDTLALSLGGVFDAVNRRIQDYQEASDYIRSADVLSPSQIEYTGVPTLTDGAQLFWLPSLAIAGDEGADSLLGNYSQERIVPTMDELAFALDGVLQTHETTEELSNVLNSYGVPSAPLFEVSRLITQGGAGARRLFKSGYLQTFAPSLELLMNESYELYRLIDEKQNKLSGTNGNLVTYGATAGQTGSKAIATSITNNANTVPNTQAVYNAVNARQNVIPVAGKYRSSNTTTTDTDISDWTATNIKGTALVTKPTSANGVVGERKIFEAGATYTNDAATNIQIATIGAVMENMENRVIKRCVEYRPGTDLENAENCWLWEFVGNSASCIATGGSCTNTNECCVGTCDNDQGVCITASPSPPDPLLY